MSERKSEINPQIANPQDHSLSSSVSDFLHASGPVPYRFTSDLMFHLVFQQNHKALIGLISSVLHLDPARIVSVEILNPIDFGSFVGDKVFILDLKVLLNDSTVINFEMQMSNEGNWKDRSLSYLCRLFDQLASGQDYIEVKPVHHVAFLDFDLPDLKPEFYSTYLLTNRKTREIYTGKFTLSVINLKRIDLATAEDRENRIDDWARLFKSTTWEEIRMLAAKNEYLQEASETLWKVSAEDRTRELNAMHEEALRRQRSREKLLIRQKEEQLKQLRQQLDAQNAIQAQMKDQLAQTSARLSEKDVKLSQKDAEIARLQSLLHDLQNPPSGQ